METRVKFLKFHILLNFCFLLERIQSFNMTMALDRRRTRALFFGYSSLSRSFRYISISLGCLSTVIRFTRHQLGAFTIIEEYYKKTRRRYEQ